MAPFLGQAVRSQAAGMRIIWSRRAIQNLIALRAFIERESGPKAAVVAGRILEALEFLRQQPQMGRPGRVLGTRELVVPNTPFIVPYRVRGQRLELLAIFHGRQNGRRGSDP